MKTLVITDLHFSNSIRGLLEAQKKCICKIIEDEKPHEMIIMGDLMTKRKPSPSVLLAIKALLDFAVWYDVSVTIIRGNHDSETKADDGITALSVFEDSTRIITHTYIDHAARRAYIPHYEDERKIIESLREVPVGYRVFGHFGYFGSLNSAGDADFNISLSEFHNSSFLGHIHRFSQRSVEVQESLETVTCLGTPYTTNFSEAGKENYYIVLGDVPEYKQVRHGPRHLVVDYDDIDSWDKILSDSTYFNLVRVYVSKLSDTDNNMIAKELLDKYSIDALEIKYKPIFDENTENYFSPKIDPFDMDNNLLQEYVENSAVELDKSYILSGLDLVNNEYKKY